MFNQLSCNTTAIDTLLFTFNSSTYRQHDQIDICRVTVLHSQRDNSLEIFEKAPSSIEKVC